jgi:Concanavalin A-like lectin/glucanases superfamily
MRKPLLATALALALLPSAASALPTPSASYDFSSTAGTTTFSTGASTVPLTLRDGATVSGGALSLDGADDYAEARNDAFYTAVDGDFAISLKARSTSWGFSWQPLAFQDDDFYDTYSWAIYGTTNDSGTVHAYVRMRSGATLETLDLYDTPRNTLSNGTWHQVALSVNGPEARMYFDGTLADAQTSTLPNATVHLGPDHMYIGGDTYFSSEKFGGSIDDVRYFQSALTQADVTHLATT